MRAQLAPRLHSTVASIFDEISGIAREHGAINLGAATPTLEPPAIAVAAACEALRGGAHRYSHVAGELALRQAVARHEMRFYGAQVDPESQVTITCGVTEGIQAAMFALLAPGDEVVVFDPAYDCYAPSIAFAGGVARPVALRSPDFELDLTALEEAFSSHTRAVILNTPHNPTGKVFSGEEIEALAVLCRRFDATVVCDEVYEHIVFDERRHARLVDLPGMRDRTLTLSGAGKTFSIPGWRIGWAIGPARLIDGLNRFRQFSAFCAPTPLQFAVGRCLDLDDEAYANVRLAYQARRDALLDAFAGSELSLIRPAGGFFALARFDTREHADGRECCLAAIRGAGVATIPLDTFYIDPAHREPLVRLSFCPTEATITEAGRRMARLR